MCMPDLTKIPKPGYDSLPIVTREEWGGVPPKETAMDESLIKSAPIIVLMHTATEPCMEKEECSRQVREMQKTHMEDLGMTDIQYNYVIGGDGNVYEGRRWDRRPPMNPKCPEYYNSCFEIMFIGNYEEKHIPYEVTNPAYDLIQVLIDKKPPPFKIVRRPEWTARRAKYEWLLHPPVQWVILTYYTDTKPCETDEECRVIMRDLQEHHKQKLKYPDIAYNFLIGGNGVVYKGRGWTTRAQRLVDRYQWYEGKSQEFAYIGDFRRYHNSGNVRRTLQVNSEACLGLHHHTSALNNYQYYGEETRLNIVRRSKWGARRPRYQELIDIPVHYVVLKYYSDTGPCETDEQCRRVVRELQLRHKKQLDWADIAYNWLIGGDGTIYKGRGWIRNAERPKDNYERFSGNCQEITYIGDFRKTDPPQVMAKAVLDLITYGVVKNFIDASHQLVIRKD